MQRCTSKTGSNFRDHLFGGKVASIKRMLTLLKEFLTMDRIEIQISSCFVDLL